MRHSNAYERRRAQRDASARRWAEMQRLEREAQNAPYVPPPEPVPPTEEQLRLAEEAEARRFAALPWWERQTPEEQAASEAARELSRYLST